MYNFELPRDLCANAVGQAVDGNSTEDAAKKLESQGLHEPARVLRLGCDLLGLCRTENCVSVMQLSQIGNDVILTDLGKSLSGCVEPD